MQQTRVTGRKRDVIIAIDKFAYWFGGHWLAVFVVLYGAWVWTPFLAPIFMQSGAIGAADGVYTFYSFFCHQLPERSIFLFGPEPMYSLDQIKSVWALDGFLGLRQFNGNAAMGWKVAWSDRMISFYGSVWLGALIFARIRKSAWRLSLVAWLFLGILPVGVDGVTHMINDAVAGTSGLGFRDTNAWLAFLTGNLFPASFYYGDAFGSFNSWMRWLTGIAFGITTVLAWFPFIADGMRDVEQQARETLARVRARDLA
ncbi:MAG: DUF2085 domain-containing protein [Chloroflexi bacterium]|nr:DUF2085 domain-containing protein [Chloroflexota bacterium]